MLDKVYRVALAQALRARRGDETGSFNFEQFCRDVETSIGRRVAAETIKAYYKKNAKLKPPPYIMAAQARLLGLPAGGAYFREFRLWQVCTVLEAHPEAMKAFYEGIMQVAEDLDGSAPEA